MVHQVPQAHLASIYTNCQRYCPKFAVWKSDEEVWLRDAAKHYQGWIDRFENLRRSEDPQIQQIGEAGVEQATWHRDRELQNERHEAVYGMR